MPAPFHEWEGRDLRTLGALGLLEFIPLLLFTIAPSCCVLRATLRYALHGAAPLAMPIPAAWPPHPASEHLSI
jgi:hypothetical protein